MRLLPLSRHVLPILFAAVACVASAHAKTTVTGNHIENDDVGFYGFGLDLPANYTAYTVPADEKFTPKNHVEGAWLLSRHLDRKAGFTTKQRIPFASPKTGIVVVVTTCTAGKFPTVKDRQAYLRTLGLFTTWGIESGAGQFRREVKQFGKVDAGCVASMKDGLVVAFNVVLIPPSTILTLYGCGAEADKDQLLKELDAATATIDFGKRAKK